MTSAAIASIDLAALQYNFSQAKQCAPDAKILAVVKANAYGHGLTQVAHALDAADGFAVAHLSEAIKLRQAGITQPIILLQGFVSAEEFRQCVEFGLTPVIHHPDQIEILSQVELKQPIDCWLKLDTGMHRLGILPESFDAVWQQLLDANFQQAPLCVMSHFGFADVPSELQNAYQRDLFLKVSKGRPGEKSLANSAAIIAQPDTHYDWVRPGIMLYGGSPFVDDADQSISLKPVMRLHSRVIAVRRLYKDEPLGYGASWSAPEDTRIAVIGIGYGDGYPRHAPTGTPVWLNGERVYTVGRVSMDMLCVQLPDHLQVDLLDQVELWGEHVSADEVARLSSTISYELFCRLTQRVKFEYHG